MSASDTVATALVCGGAGCLIVQWVAWVWRTMRTWSRTRVRPAWSWRFRAWVWLADYDGERTRARTARHRTHVHTWVCVRCGKRH